MHAALDSPPTWPTVCALLARWLQANLPGTTILEVSLKLNTGTILPMPFVAMSSLFPPGLTNSVPVPAPESVNGWQPFTPRPFQQAILDALAGKALHARALGAKVGDSGRLYKPHGIQELRERGLVELHERLGFWRPDAPPPELEQEAAANIPGE